MSRLASAAKAHYYPLPVELIPLIASYVAAPHGGRLLDPCTGEGVALKLLAQQLALEPFGNELDENRAAAALQATNTLLQQRQRQKYVLAHQDRQLTRVFHSDYRFMRIGPNSFTCLYINPPFDYDERDGRLEYQFLRDTRPYLAASGLLIFVVPQKLLTHRRTVDYLASWFTDLRVFRFPDNSYPTFKQIIVFGRRQRKTAVPDPQTIQSLQAMGRSGEALSPITPAVEPVYQLPRVTASTHQLTFIPHQVDIKLVFQEAQTQGVVASAAWQAARNPTPVYQQFQPLTPLRQGHLVNIISAGYLNNHMLSDEQDRLFIKGRTYKATRSHSEREYDSQGGYKETHYDTEQYVTDITTIRPDGTIQSVTGQKLEPFLQRWISPLTQAVVDTYKPVYQFDLNGYDAVFNRLNQGRLIPNTKMRGLAPAQKHAAAAAATRLDKRYKNQREALIVGEMGVGKTLIGPAVAACIRARRIIVLCPPHLTGKWAREIGHVIPEANVSQLQTISDVDRFFAAPAMTAAPLFGILKETTARSASGWRHAYNWCGPINQARPPNGRKKQDWTDLQTASKLIPPTPGSLQDDLKLPNGRFISGAKRFTYIMKQRLPSCPHCGAVLMGNGVPLSPGDFKGKRRKCPDCRSPLSYFTRRLRDDERPLTMQQCLRRQDQICANIRLQRDAYHGLKKSGTNYYAKCPLATYINKHYKRCIDLLLVDEIHQYKSADSDRGYAFHRLACASKKVLGLTGTIYGGKASTIFHLLYRLAPEMKRHFAHNDIKQWISQYGVLQEIESVKYDRDGKQTGNSRASRRVKELPGGSPAMMRWLLNRSVFLSLEDMGFALPDYTETPHTIPMTPAMAANYGALQAQLKDELKDRLVRGDRSLLAAYLQALISWPDSPWRGKVVRDPHTDEVVATIPAVPGLQPGQSPKEQTILAAIRDELAQNRKVLLLCQQTDTLDITPQWQAMLKAKSVQSAVLRCEPRRREAWIHKQEANGTQVIITHPKRIETGLDILGFPTVIWIGQDFSVYTVLQACRRPYRIGQTRPVKVLFYSYANTLQETALMLVASKMAAALRVDGNTVTANSLAELDQLTSSDIVTTLAKIVTGQRESLGVASLRDAFRQANGELQGQHQYMGDYAISPSTNGQTAVAPPLTNISKPNGTSKTQPMPLLPPQRSAQKLTLLNLLRG